MSDKLIQTLLLPLMAYAACGLIVSLAIHLLAFAGLQPKSNLPLFVMFFVLFPLGFVVTLISMKLMKGASWRYWQVVFARCPAWMTYTVKSLYVYALVNFAVFTIVLFFVPTWIKSIEDLWRLLWILASSYLILFYFVGLATLMPVYRRRMEPISYELAGKDTQDTPVEKNKQFDPEFCGMISRIGAAACLVLILCTPILLTTVHSSKCPGWVIPTRQGNPPSVWGLFAATAPWALVVTYYAVTWRRFAQRIIDRIEWGERTLVTGTEPPWYGGWTQFRATCAREIYFNALFVTVMIFSVAFTAVPLLGMAINCF